MSNRNGHSTIIFNDRVIIFFDVLMCITIAVPTPYFKIFFSRQTLENLKMLFLSVLHYRNQSVREANPKQNTVLDISHQPPSAQTFPIITTYVFIRSEWLQPLYNKDFVLIWSPTLIKILTNHDLACCLHFISKMPCSKRSWVRPKLSNFVLTCRSLICWICAVFHVPPPVVPRI